MRLGQLARKLALRPAEIIAFLSQHNITIEDNTNTRIDHEHLKLVLKQFASADFENEELIKNDVEPIEEIVTPEIVKNSITEVPVEVIENRESVSEHIPVQPVEVIKAPKVELSGLRVLGKIELREPKKKEKPEESSSEIKQEVEPPRKTSRQPYQKRNNESKPRKNPIALQREREALEAKLRREEEVKREKERRTEYYLRKVKSVPTKSAKLVNEPLEQGSAYSVAEPPKTLLGRFLRWLTT